MDDKQRRDLMTGVRDIAPILLGVIPFAMVSGITAVGAGIPKHIAMLMSLSMFAGASQLAANQLIGAGAAWFVIIYTALVINARFVVYSASVAPYLQSLSSPAKWLYAYLLTDQGYALSVLRFRRGDNLDPHLYYLGISVTIWLTWQVFSAAGIYLGSNIPEHWGLDFAVPLCFLAVLVQALEDRESIVAGATAGCIAVFALPLPLNTNLILGVMTGIGAGLLSEHLRHRREGRF